MIASLAGVSGINFARLKWNRRNHAQAQPRACGEEDLLRGVTDMGVERVINGVHTVPMGMANAYLIEDDDGVTLIDAGFPNKQVAVFEAIRALGLHPR